MASERGRWLRDQTSVRFGDWAISVGAAPSTTWGFVSVLEAGTDVAESNWRAVAEKERWLMANWRDSLWAARNLVAEIIVLGNWLVGATFWSIESSCKKRREVESWSSLRCRQSADPRIYFYFYGLGNRPSRRHFIATGAAPSIAP